MHDTSWFVPLTREQQFELDWTNHARWAPGPVGSRETFRIKWEELHADCRDCATAVVGAERGSAMRAALLLSVVVASVVLLGTALRPTEAAPAPMGSFRACAQEDSRSCVWDARHQGNGAGTSFISGPKGQTIYVTHRVAHTLICGSLGATPKPRWC